MASTFLVGTTSPQEESEVVQATRGSRDTEECEVLQPLPAQCHKIPEMPRLWKLSRFSQIPYAVFLAAGMPVPTRREHINELIIHRFTARDLIYACVSFPLLVGMEGASASALLKLRLNESDLLPAPTWITIDTLHDLFAKSSPESQHELVNVLPYDLVAGYITKYPLECIAWKMTFLELVRLKGRSSSASFKIPLQILEQLFGCNRITKGLLD